MRTALLALGEAREALYCATAPYTAHERIARTEALKAAREAVEALADRLRALAGGGK